MSAPTLAVDAMLLLFGLVFPISYAVWEYLATRAWVECCECGRRYPGDGLRCPACEDDLMGDIERYISAANRAEHAAETERGL